MVQTVERTCAMSSKQLKMYFLASFDFIPVSVSCSSVDYKKKKSLVRTKELNSVKQLLGYVVILIVHVLINSFIHAMKENEKPGYSHLLIQK